MPVDLAILFEWTILNLKGSPSVKKKFDIMCDPSYGKNIRQHVKGPTSNAWYLIQEYSKFEVSFS